MPTTKSNFFQQIQKESQVAETLYPNANPLAATNPMFNSAAYKPETKGQKQGQNRTGQAAAEVTTMHRYQTK